MKEHSTSDEEPQLFDFVVVGAGITGINSAFRIIQYFPNKSYTILERRHESGGTWSFFKYPGIRSDSDLYTMGFTWKPWEKSSPIADGPSIVQYVRGAASDHGIDREIQYGHDVLSFDWQSTKQVWNVHVRVSGMDKIIRARFVIAGTGFFDYQNARATTVPGIQRFKGVVAHPQFWSEKIDYTDKTVVIIGSGATAVTIFPVVAQKARKTIMLQRSPTYIMSMAMQSSLDSWLRRMLPMRLAYAIIAWRFTLMAWLFFYFTQFFPNAAKGVLKSLTMKDLPKGATYEPNYQPSYNVWDQRLCVCPDGDFFRAMDDNKAEVITAEIETVEEDGIRLRGGQTIKADVIVTATGLKLQMLGGAKLSIDSKRHIGVGEQYMWRGTMLQDVPNLMIVIGYWNNSWTLGSDLATRIFLNCVRDMEKQGMTSFVPTLSADEEAKLVRMPLWRMSSTYLQNDVYPKASTTGPWTVKDNYMRDWLVLMFGNLRKGMKFDRVVEG